MTEGARRVLGAAGLALVLVIAVGVAAVIAWALRRVPFGWAIEAALATSLMAQRSLFEHVAAVARALGRGGLKAARRTVAEIVGRDPDSLDAAGVCRAAIESLAENFSDGVVAPALWFAIAGLPGMAAYKAINTADSMIGHLGPRHRAFGWAAARLDDLVNLPASRLAALLLVLAALFAPGARAGAAARTAWRDAGRHRSPNAGWPEAAMAGALGLRLAGPRVYGGERVDDAWMGDGRAEAESADIRAALGLYRLACATLWLTAGTAAGILSL
jgi:adenosylcobinamide-phosphate synthase